MAQGLDDQALANLSSCSPEQRVPQLEQFKKFVLGQRMSASEAQSHEVAESISKTHDELLREQARNEALNRTVESLSARSIKPRPIRMDPPKFDGTAVRTIVHWLLAVEQCGVAQLIEDDTRMVSYAISHLRGKSSKWAYSALMANSKAFYTDRKRSWCFVLVLFMKSKEAVIVSSDDKSTVKSVLCRNTGVVANGCIYDASKRNPLFSWAIFKTKIRAIYQPPNNEVLLRARFFSKRSDPCKTMYRRCALCRRLLVWSDTGKH
uniref:Uncharacterized protein n=1 Tax=Hyaloperonospora arabidopsidis (strain Emoy2) TaxID=559515 RepID=M4C5T9_HYAAE